MTSDHCFESTYVGHFVSDGTSFGLRRASSIRRREVAMHPLHRSPKVSSELPRVLGGRERSPPTGEVVPPPVTTSTPQHVQQTSTRARSQSEATHASPSSIAASERRSSAPPARIPIWARGTVSHPVHHPSPSQTKPSVRRVQSQSTLSSNSRPTHPARSSSMEQSALTTIHENTHVTKIVPPSPSRNPIRQEMSTSQRSNSMPVAQLASRSGSRRTQQNPSTREPLRAASTAHQIILTRRSVSPLGTGNPASVVSRRVVASAHTSPSINPMSSRTPSPRISRTIPSTPSLPSRSALPQQAASSRARPGYRLRSVASQPSIRSSKKVAQKTTHEKAKSVHHTDIKGGAEGEGECCICMNAQSDSVLYRCGHICACMPCAKNMKQCPICREQVTDVIKIWKI